MKVLTTIMLHSNQAILESTFSALQVPRNTVTPEAPKDSPLPDLWGEVDQKDPHFEWLTFTFFDLGSSIG